MSATQQRWRNYGPSPIKSWFNLKKQKYQGFIQWYEVTQLHCLHQAVQKQRGSYKFWRAPKGLFFKTEDTLYQTFFLQHLESFGEDRNKHGVCLPNALGEGLRRANGRVNPGFLREEQRSEKLIFKKGNQEKKTTGHSLSGSFSLVLYGVSWVCHIPYILCTGAAYCCHQCQHKMHSPAKGHLLESISELNASFEKNRDMVKATRVRRN